VCQGRGEAARVWRPNLPVRVRNGTPLRDSRATLHGGSERFQAVGEAGSRPASFLLDPASLQPIRVVSGGGGIRTPRDLNGPLRFSRPHTFGSTMRAGARCATKRATVVGYAPSSLLRLRTRARPCPQQVAAGDYRAGPGDNITAEGFLYAGSNSRSVLSSGNRARVRVNVMTLQVGRCDRGCSSERSPGHP
jgi:hypothetical protein